MKFRFLTGCTALWAMLATCAAVQAGMTRELSGLPSQLTGAAIPIDYDRRPGCNRDTPCRQRPRARDRGQIYIGNNYGTVNIYADGGRYRRQPQARCRYTVCCDGDPCRDRWPDRRPVRDTYPPEPPRPCGRYPCDPNCGAHCWMRRFRSGYCGQGCDFYREKVRIGEEERTVRGPNVVFYTDPAPAAEPARVRDDARMPGWESDRNADRGPSRDRDRDGEASRELDDDRSGKPYDKAEYPRQERK